MKLIEADYILKRTELKIKEFWNWKQRNKKKKQNKSSLFIHVQY